MLFLFGRFGYKQQLNTEDIHVNLALKFKLKNTCEWLRSKKKTVKNFGISFRVHVFVGIVFVQV